MSNCSIARRAWLALLVIACGWAGLATAQTSYRIVWLVSTPSTQASMKTAIAVFQAELRTLGYVEGKNLSVAYRFADAGIAALPALAREVVNSKPDLILTDSSFSTDIVRKATTSIPILMAVSASPVEQGFVASLAKPGGNITGMTMMSPEVAEKRLELLRLAAPHVKRVAVLTPLASQSTRQTWQQIELTARRLGIALVPLETPARDVDFVRLIDQAVAQKADALLVMPFPLFAQHAAQIAALALKQRLPTMFFDADAVREGALMSYGANIADLFRRLAPVADKVLKGAKPGDIPIEQPTKFDLFINAATARKLGIKISPELLLRADEVIQ